MYTPTIDEIMALEPCGEYPRSRVAELLSHGFTLSTLLSLPPADARWILARLLPRNKAIRWARRCALAVASEKTPEIVAKWLRTGRGNIVEVIAAAYAASDAYADAYAAAAAAAHADAAAHAAYAAAHAAHAAYAAAYAASDAYAAAATADAANAAAAANAATHKRQIKWALNLLNKGRLS
jgi:hypothetical protein